MPTIPLSKGYVAVVDDEDADLAALPFYASISSRTGHVYAKRSLPRDAPIRASYLHREIAARMGPIPDGFDVDHKNQDTLDCRRENLHPVPHQVNMWNRRANKTSKSGIPGVRFRAEKGKWQAYICSGLKMVTLGSFATMEEAHAARLKAEAERLATLVPQSFFHTPRAGH